MSVDGDEDTELRDLVISSLKSAGVLGKLRANLRSNVYLALEGQLELQSKSRHTNSKLDDFLKSSEGRLAIHLIREFLDFFDLEYSRCVFEPEAAEGRCRGSLKSRDELSESLGLAETLRPDQPILSEIIRLSKVNILRSETPSLSEEVSHKSEDETSLQSSLNEDKSTTSQPRQSLSANTPTPENSFSNLINNKSANITNPDATFTVEKDTKPEIKSSGNILSSLADLPKLSSQSSLSDLPPLMSNSLASPGRPSTVKLASLKKVPSFEKSKTATEDQTISTSTPATTLIPSAAATKTEAKSERNEPDVKSFVSPLKPNLSLEDDDIEEEIYEFLNSSVSASEDFTKDESASEAQDLKADFVEKLP